uniref:Uncharacterized protein n=1 Tax=Oryza brachyantha TaxID=4533 RepID=J3LCA8_ORYBR
MSLRMPLMLVEARRDGGRSSSWRSGDEPGDLTKEHEHEGREAYQMQECGARRIEKQEKCSGGSASLRRKMRSYRTGGRRRAVSTVHQNRVTVELYHYGAIEAAAPPQPPWIQADVVVMGYVPCNNGTSMKSSSAPGFPNAVVQLQCADAVGAAAGNATTDNKGWFRMATNTSAALSSVASGCSLQVVDMPLATCNASPPETGTLESGLRLLVSMVFFPRGFSYVAPGLSIS